MTGVSCTSDNSDKINSAKILAVFRWLKHANRRRLATGRGAGTDTATVFYQFN